MYNKCIILGTLYFSLVVEIRYGLENNNNKKYTNRNSANSRACHVTSSVLHITQLLFNEYHVKEIPSS